MADERKNEYVYKSTLKGTYGLTDSWIKKLGEPDKTVPNPHYRSGPPASLYRIERVEAFIDANHDEWLKLQERRRAYRKVARKVADKKRQETIEWAETVEIEAYRKRLPRNQSKLENAVREQWVNFRAFERGDYVDYVDFTMSHNALVAYLRHNHTSYEFLLDELPGRVGTADAYAIIRDRCDELANRLLDEVRGEKR